MDAEIVETLKTFEVDFLDASNWSGDNLRKLHSRWLVFAEQVEALLPRLHPSTIATNRECIARIGTIAQHMLSLLELSHQSRADVRKSVSILRQSPKPISTFAPAAAFFLKYLANPNPSRRKLPQLAQQCGCTPEEITKWFKDTRKALGYLELGRKFCHGNKATLRDLLTRVLVDPDPTRPVPKGPRDAVYELRERALEMLHPLSFGSLENNRPRPRRSYGFLSCRRDKQFITRNATSNTETVSNLRQHRTHSRLSSATPSLTDGDSEGSPSEEESLVLEFLPPETPDSLILDETRPGKRKRSEDQALECAPLGKQSRLAGKASIVHHRHTSADVDKLLSNDLALDSAFELPFDFDAHLHQDADILYQPNTEETQFDVFSFATHFGWTPGPSPDFLEKNHPYICDIASFIPEEEHVQTHPLPDQLVTSVSLTGAPYQIHLNSEDVNRDLCHTMSQNVDTVTYHNGCLSIEPGSGHSKQWEVGFNSEHGEPNKGKQPPMDIQDIGQNTYLDDISWHLTHPVLF